MTPRRAAPKPAAITGRLVSVLAFMSGLLYFVGVGGLHGRLAARVCRLPRYRQIVIELCAPAFAFDLLIPPGWSAAGPLTRESLVVVYAELAGLDAALEVEPLARRLVVVQADAARLEAGLDPQTPGRLVVVGPEFARPDVSFDLHLHAPFGDLIGFG